MSRSVSILILVVIIIGVIAGGLWLLTKGGGKETTTPVGEKGITLVIITRHDTTIQEKTKQLFLSSEIAKKYNIKDLKFIEVGPALWESYIARGGVDIGWGGGPTLFDMLLEDDYLEPLTSDLVLEEVAKIPDDISGVPLKRYNDKGELMWVAAAISSFGFTINKEVLNEYGLPTPKTWADLGSIDLAKTGQLLVGIADPTKSTSNTRIYEIILQAYGWEEGWKLLARIAGNSRVYDASDAVRIGVINGEIAVGITIDFYGYTAMVLNPNCEYIVPQGASIINGDPIALIKGSKHKEAAEAFIAWVLSESGGQQVWMDQQINRLPANPKVFETPAGKQREDLKNRYYAVLNTQSINFNDTRALATERAMQEYFKAVLVDAHDDLVEAWRTIVNAYVSGRISKEEFKAYAAKLGEPLEFKDPRTGEIVKFTEEYAKSINDLIKKDPSYLNALKSTWRDKAIEKYREIISELSG